MTILRQWQESLPPEWQTAELPEQEHAQAALQRAQTQLQSAREDERVARAAMEERRSAVAERNAAVLKLQSAVDYQIEMVQLRQEKLCNDAEITPDDQLAAATDAAAQAVTVQATDCLDA